jgi:IclR family transcriptional regulator, acetate operon repressor
MLTAQSSGAHSRPADRLFSVLELVAEMGMVSSSDLVNVLELPRPTAHRLLSQLEEMRLLQKMPYPSKYGASPRLTQLANGLMRSTLIRAPLKALLMSLSRLTGQTHHIAVCTQAEVEYFEVVETGALPLTFPAGKRVPLHCNATGQYFLSQLPEKQLKQFLRTAPWHAFTKQTITEPQALLKRINEIQQKDYAIQDSEFVQGVIGLAVPIRTPRGRLVATLVARVDNSKRSLEQVESLLPIMRSYAARAGKFF